MLGRFIFLLVVACILVAFVNGHRRCKTRRKCCSCDCRKAQPHSQSTSQSVPPISPSTVPPTAPSSGLPITPSSVPQTLSSGPPTAPSSGPPSLSSVPATSPSNGPPTLTSSVLPTAPSTATVAPSVPPSTSRSVPPNTTCLESCPPGWALYNQYCYQAIYDGYKPRKYYDDICGQSQNNSQLVSIHSAGENTFVTNLVANSGNASYGIWIGMTLANAADAFNSPKYWTDQANRYLQSGDFGFVSGQFPWTTASAPDGAPSPSNCTLLWINNENHPRGTWDDLDCGNTQYANVAVCKQPSYKPCPACPDGWKILDNHCYKFLSEGAKSRDTYDRMCGQEHSHLVSLPGLNNGNYREYGFVQELAINASGGDTNSNYAFWIGLTLTNASDPDNSPKYWTDQANRYLQSGDFGYGKVNHISMYPWGINQPDGSPSPANCTLWHLHYNWNDVNCDNPQPNVVNGTVCKMPAKDNTLPPLLR